MPDGSQVMVDWPDPLYPCIIVNIGSGVSVLRLDAGESGEPYFTRLGGTATGGAAFLGLVRMMTSAKTYPDCLALAQKGDATRCSVDERSLDDVEGRRKDQNSRLVDQVRVFFIQVSFRKDMSDMTPMMNMSETDFAE